MSSSLPDRPASPADKRAAILEAGLNLLAHKGFHGFSMKQLADAAGVATGTLYLYFKDRDDMIMQLYDEILQCMAAKAFIGYCEDMPLRQRYQWICRNLWHFFIAHPDALLCKTQFDYLPKETLPIRTANTRQYFHPLIRLFEQGKAEGIVKNLPEEALLCLGIEPVVALAYRHYLDRVQVDDTCLEQVLESSWQALEATQA